MDQVRAKKSLGQHFLKDLDAAQRIAEAIIPSPTPNVLEIGPGMGVLTKFLIKQDLKLKVIDIDRESIEYLKSNFTELTAEQIISDDFLRIDIARLFPGKFSIIGNFPYNISSQIVFKMLDHKDDVLMLAGMFQKEVAERIISPPGSKEYGILSVLVQAYYDGEYLFTVEPAAFNPPPKVRSGVIRLTRRNEDPSCSYSNLKAVVKMAFNQRRKTLRNALKQILPTDQGGISWLDKRAEQLNVQDFIQLTNLIYKS